MSFNRWVQFLGIGFKVRFKDVQGSGLRVSVLGRYDGVMRLPGHLRNPGPPITAVEQVPGFVNLFQFRFDRAKMFFARGKKH